jgi:heme/copper-type cytochrome/quinol oxidase subunit 2
LILEEDLPFGTKRLLEVNRRAVLPINVTLRFLVTSGDVLHS